MTICVACHRWSTTASDASLDATNPSALGQHGAIEIDEVDPIGVQRVGEHRQQRVRVKGRVRLVCEVPVGMGVRLVAGSRAVQQQQLQAWRGRGDPRECVGEIRPGCDHVDP
jgi:hypothetical protein